jgi:hypothetical protein
MATERAVIYLPPGSEGDRWLNAAMEYAVGRRHYEVVSVARDWSAVLRSFQQGLAEVAVVVLKEHPPPDRPQRVEYVEEEGPAPSSGPPDRRRPRPIPRDGEDEP